MDLYKSDDYRLIIRNRIGELPRKGFGQLGKLAEKLSVNASFISQMLAGSKNLSEDQAYVAAEFFDFSVPETSFSCCLSRETEQRITGSKLSIPNRYYL